MFPDLLTLGGILLAALAVHDLAPRVGLPRVTLLMLLGVAVGPIGLNAVPVGEWFETTTVLALTMIGLLLGGEFTWSSLKEHGRDHVALSLGLSVGTAITVALGLVLLGVPWPLALLFGGIAPATDPAATIAVVEELDAEGPFSATIRRVVALDDVWGLLAYSLAVAGAAFAMGHAHPNSEVLHAVTELGGSVLLGGVLGALAAPVTGRIRPGQPTLLEALGLILVCAGGAEWLGLSPLLSALSMGVVLANLASHHDICFRQVEDIEWPVLVVFFVLAGASLELDALAQASGLVAAYVGLRAVGRFLGIGATATLLGKRDRGHRVWLPTALMPQAGVALGLTLSAANQFPDQAGALIPVVIASTLIFELVGPPLTRLALIRVGEVAQG